MSGDTGAEERVVARPLIVAVAVAVGAVACGWIVYAIVGRAMIESAYQGEGSEFLAGMMRDRGTRSLSSYYTSMEQLLAHVSAAFVMVVTAVAALSFGPRTSAALRLWVVVSGVTLVVTMAVVAPGAQGDGPEYMLMAESWANHLSPELRAGDLESLRELGAESDLPLARRDPAQYYFEAGDGNRYCYHFWFYSLVAMPAKMVLRMFDASEARAFQLTNAVLFALALYLVAARRRVGASTRWGLVFLAFFSPALWFVYWPHPEVMCFSLVLVALVLSREGRGRVAVLLAALASMQQPPLVFLVAWLIVRGMWAAPRRAREAGIMALVALPALVPFVFFQVGFGTWSLVGREAARWEDLSILRALELFFDLNIGMLPYVPVALALFAGAIIRDLRARTRPRPHLQGAVVLFVLAVACTPTFLWNHGTTGPSRYVIWMLPLVLVSAVQGLDGPRRRHHVVAIGAAVLFQVVVVGAYGGLTPPITQMNHTGLARFVLRYAPALYNPSPEIFAVRTSHRMPDITYDEDTGYQAALPPTPIVYTAGGQCRKALVRGAGAAALESRCGEIPESDAGFFMFPDNAPRLTYVDF